MGQEYAQGVIPHFIGDVLLCEDSEINQHFAKNHLTRVGLSVLIANNGREGVDAVVSRHRNGEKPFDLIFMDIQMPVMGGLEAANMIISEGVKTPIVALTANVTERDRQIYAEHGMLRSLCKPFTAEELWECLGEYFTPVSLEQINEYEREREAKKQQDKLYSSFVRRNQTTYTDICAALDTDDIKLAHRLAHTLRGLAGLMGKKELQESARVVELALADGDKQALTEEQLQTLGGELHLVLEELAPYLEERTREAPAAEFNKEAARALFDRLEPLLLGDNAESQRYADEVRAIPGSAELVVLLEDYEFEDALVKLAELRKTLQL